jgi:ATP-dependent Lon protease
MIESSEIAYTTVRGLCRKTGSRFFDEHFIHLHVPAGAVPKDGPSAGVTMALALYSLALGRPVKHGMALTGELNLSGLVMPVGGIREKLIAARRAKVKEVILPIGNRSDYDQLPAMVKRHLKVHFAETFGQVAKWCLPGVTTPEPAAHVSPTKKKKTATRRPAVRKRQRL